MRNDGWSKYAFGLVFVVLMGLSHVALFKSMKSYRPELGLTELFTGTTQTLFAGGVVFLFAAAISDWQYRRALAGKSHVKWIVAMFGR